MRCKICLATVVHQAPRLTFMLYNTVCFTVAGKKTRSISNWFLFFFSNLFSFYECGNCLKFPEDIKFAYFVLILCLHFLLCFSFIGFSLVPLLHVFQPYFLRISDSLLVNGSSAYRSLPLVMFRREEVLMCGIC